MGYPGLLVLDCYRLELLLLLLGKVSISLLQQVPCLFLILVIETGAENLGSILPCKYLYYLRVNSEVLH